MKNRIGSSITAVLVAGALACSGSVTPGSGSSGASGGSSSSGASGSSGTTPDSGVSSSSGGSSSSSSSSSGGGAQCNALVQQGAVVTTEVKAEPPPAHLGGVLVDGTYVLTAFNFYGPNPVPPATFQATVEKAGGTMSFLWNRPGEESRVVYTTKVVGAALMLAETCRFSVPASSPQAPVNFEYGATSTGFQLYLEGNGGEAEMVFSKK